MLSSSPAALQGERISFSRILQASLLAMVISVVINAILYFIGYALGAFPDTFIIPNAGLPLTVAPVIMFSIIGVIGATIAYAIISRLTRKPTRLFQIIAAVVLLLSFVTPFTVPGAPLLFVIILELMHIVVAATVVILFSRMTRTN